MPAKAQLFFDNITSRSKKVFLLDSLGATLAAFFLGVILTRFEHFFGMPKTTLYYLSSIACVYAIYSICCFFLLTKAWELRLIKGIIVANLLYSCLTAVLVIYFYQKLTILGLMYFSLELLIMIGLIIIERMTFIKLIKEKI